MKAIADTVRKWRSKTKAPMMLAYWGENDRFAVGIDLIWLNLGATPTVFADSLELRSYADAEAHGYMLN